MFLGACAWGCSSKGVGPSQGAVTPEVVGTGSSAAATSAAPAPAADTASAAATASTGSRLAATPARPASAPTPPAAAPPTPLRHTLEQAKACAQKVSRKVVAKAELTHLPDAAGRAPQHWFELTVGKGRGLAVVVDDTDCSAALSPSVGHEARFDPATAKRFVRLRGRVWQVVDRDRERKATCRRLEGLKAKHGNLRGCVAWLEQFPDDLCTKPAPPPRPDGLSPLHERLNHRCYWHVYLGEDMGTHTNRHATLVIDAGAGRLVGGLLPGGGAIPAAVWAGAGVLRKTLGARLATEPAVRERCAGRAACPTVGELASTCRSARCFAVLLRDSERPWWIETDERGQPTRVYGTAHQDGQPLADWLATLAAPASPP